MTIPADQWLEYNPNGGNEPIYIYLFKSPWVIGRSSADYSPDFSFPEPEISRQHAELIRVGAEWQIRDTSRHGIHINGVRLGKSFVTLRNGDELVLSGRTRMVYFDGSTRDDNTVGLLWIDGDARKVFLGPIWVSGISSKQFDFLALLSQRKGNAVSKDEILDICWPDHLAPDDPATQNMLKQMVRRLRTSLGRASPGAENAVQSVHGYGYRLLV